MFKDKFFVGTNWLGGVMFNKPHDIFKELPVEMLSTGPYQALIHYRGGAYGISDGR